MDATPAGWQPRDLRSGVEELFAEARRKAELGTMAAAAWAAGLLVFALLEWRGFVSVAAAGWDLAAGGLALLLAALSTSRKPGILIVVLLLLGCDLVVVAHGIPWLLSDGGGVDFVATLLRLLPVPVVAAVVLGGYSGCAAIEAFRNGFSPANDRRAAISPRTVQLVVAGLCVGTMMVGIASGTGQVMDAARGSHWMRTLMENLPVGSPAKGGGGGSLADAVRSADLLTAPNGTNAPASSAGTPSAPGSAADEGRGGDAVGEYPESARPIVAVDGLDAYAASIVGEALEFGAAGTGATCLSEAHRRHDRCHDDRCRHWAGVFARACLARVPEDPAFCRGVPDAREAGAGAAWARPLCGGRDFEQCRQLLYAVQGHCHPPAS